MAAVGQLYSVELATTRSRRSRSHLLASQPHGTYLEVFHPDRDPIWWGMIANRPELSRRQLRAAATARASAGSSTSDFIERYQVTV